MAQCTRIRLLASAGDTTLMLGLGRSHMQQGNQAPVPQLLNPPASTAKAGAPQQEKPPREARVLQLERIGPCLLQLEKHQEATEIQHIQK